MHLAPLEIKSNIRNYQVLFEDRPDFVGRLAAQRPAFFIIDENVWRLYKERLFAALPQERLYIFKATEENKTLPSVSECYKRIMALAPRKNLHLISIGGGITQDVTGFVASTLYRGIQWTFVPTTLLAQVDSCIGAKTSLNFLHYKNLIGSFYPPCRIHIWPGFVSTLTEVDYYSGVGEMAKLHIMDGESSTRNFMAGLDALARREEAAVLALISRCLAIKKDYIENDEFDTGRRNLLNYGHCFGHAIESASHFQIPHGQAVVLGMLLANRYAAEQGLLSTELEAFVRRKVLLPVIKVDLNGVTLAGEEVVKAMGQDKKNTGNGLALVMLTDGYRMKKITDMTPQDALALIGQLKELLK